MSSDGFAVLTPDEMQILDACLTGETAKGVATWTAFPISKARKLLKRLESRGLVRRTELVERSGARPVILWVREGPMD